MFQKVSKLKKFGIFRDFSWSSDTPDFARFNLIYGWNKSGKTTFSRIFSTCEKKTTEFKQYPKDGEFEIKTDSTTLKNTDVATNSLPIKVFNEDFINENISFDPSDSCNPIIYVSEEDIESKKMLEQLRLAKTTIGKTFEEAKKNKTAKEEVKSSFLTGLGREIANILFDKSYNKTKAENKINSIGVDNFADKTLSDEDKKKYEAISKSEAGKNQTSLSNCDFSISFEGKIINEFQKVFEIIEKLLGKKVVSETLERLKNDQNLNIWVKQGFDLHKTKDEKKKCLFCQKPLDDDFLNSLSKHFSKDYEDSQKAVFQLKDEILKIKRAEIALKNDDLYPDLKEEYTVKAKELNEVIGKINIWIDDVISKLSEKHNNPLIVIANPETPEDFLVLYNEAIAKLNKIISDHNKKAENHVTEVASAREKLELHSIAIALSTQDYKKFNSELKDTETKEKEASEAVNKNNSEILELEKKTSNIGKAIKEINKHLKEFFGREEIKLELDRDKKGYTIKRDGQPAKNLSQSEKTAIAFSYFIVKVEEKEFKIKDGIIFIDDPISSFDSNFIYHCFSLISTHFKEAGQLFISTHNFQLFNLAKEWFINKNNHTKKDNDKAKVDGRSEKPMPCDFFMVENFTESDVRKAKIVELDKTLRNYKSEYHFLFSLLNKFKDVELDYADFYTIGNVARRFFDIFADFKIPDSRDQKQKMEAIVKESNEGKEENKKISDSDWNKAYKLVNEFSHNSDPTSTIEHKDKSESKDAIKILLNIVKESDPKHFEILTKNTE